MNGRAIAFGISVLPDVNIHGIMGRFWSSSTVNFTRCFHEHGLTVSNAIPLGRRGGVSCSPILSNILEAMLSMQHGLLSLLPKLRHVPH